MAKLFPEKIPLSIQEDPKRSAEIKVYKALKELPNRYRVFYSLHWQSTDDQRGASEGEADFIIAHPDKGVIILEVKGGGITYDASNDQWSSQSRDGEFHSITDPIAQGRRNHYAIKAKLENLPSWPKRKLNIWHAVCFPDVFLKPDQYLKPDLHRDLIIDVDDLYDISTSIDRLFSHCFGENIGSGAPGNDRMQIIEGFLANSFSLSTPLSVDLDSDDEQLIQLTEQQFMTLSLLQDRKRVAIAGCAGSGKTMLAVHKAKQYSELGMSVLLVCFNAALCEYLKWILPGSIEVYTFHGLCRAAAHQVGFSIKPSSDQNEIYGTILPEALLSAADEIGRVYDAIIVDEGQDFQDNFWIGLEALLKEDGYFYIFFDNNQNLFGGSTNFSGLVTEAPFPLTRNCRNTRSIHDFVVNFHHEPSKLECIGPEGRDPEFIQYSNDVDLKKKLQQLLHQLINVEHIGNDDIVVLTPLGERRTNLKSGLRLASFELCDHAPRQLTQIQVTSVYKFKGLESKVVILTEIDAKTQYNRDMVLYVGCSRARVHLILMVKEEVANSLIELTDPNT